MKAFVGCDHHQTAMKMRKTLLILLMLLSLGLYAQHYPVCDNINYKDDVRTVLLYAGGDQTAEPIITLGNVMGGLTLSFDVLGNEANVLNYTLIHCTHDWQPTDMQRINYVSGYESGRIDDYSYSVNTLIDYVNYRLMFPNEDMVPLLSGNYLLVVYGSDMSENNLYFTRRFMVLDEKAHVGATVPRYTDDLTLSDTHQQLNVKATLNDIMSGNVQDYANLTVRQNGRWDNAVVGLKPSYIYPDHISFEHDPLTVFEATNQFIRFNTSNFYFQSENLADIRQTNDYYIIDIATCESRARKPYVTYEDSHGKKVIYIANEGRETATEADYAWVNFFLRWDAPLTHEDMYIMGAINDWNFNETNRMTYDYKLHGYICSMLLKQGYYNFMFATVDRDSYQVSTEKTAGNFWETNNQYQLYFYYYNAIKGYDELVGYSVVNSH